MALYGRGIPYSSRRDKWAEKHLLSARARQGFGESSLYYILNQNVERNGAHKCLSLSQKLKFYVIKNASWTMPNPGETPRLLTALKHSRHQLVSVLYVRRIIYMQWRP
jgi:hypothetical protein